MYSCLAPVRCGEVEGMAYARWEVCEVEEMAYAIPPWQRTVAKAVYPFFVSFLSCSLGVFFPSILFFLAPSSFSFLAFILDP